MTKKVTGLVPLGPDGQNEVIDPQDLKRRTTFGTHTLHFQAKDFDHCGDDCVDALMYAVHAIWGEQEKPMCWVCKKLVEVLERDRDTFRGVTIFTARCHGDTQTVELTDAQMNDLSKLDMTWAFKPDPREELYLQTAGPEATRKLLEQFGFEVPPDDKESDEKLRDRVKRAFANQDRGTISSVAAWFNDNEVPVIFKEYKDEFRIAFGCLEEHLELVKEGMRHLIPIGVQVEYKTARKRIDMKPKLLEESDEDRNDMA